MQLQNKMTSYYIISETSQCPHKIPVKFFALTIPPQIRLCKTHWGQIFFYSYQHDAREAPEISDIVLCGTITSELITVARIIHACLSSQKIHFLLIYG